MSPLEGSMPYPGSYDHAAQMQQYPQSFDYSPELNFRPETEEQIQKDASEYLGTQASANRQKEAQRI